MAVIAAVRTPVIQAASMIATGMPVPASLSRMIPATWARPWIDLRETREGIVEGLLRQRPEIHETARQRQHPAILELLLPPERRERLGLGPDRIRMAHDRRIHVEQCAIGMKHHHLGIWGAFHSHFVAPLTAAALI
jgi:hypothetical protein